MNETHAQTMDRTYRLMKHVYDATRPLFLAGRPAIRHRIIELSPAHVAEIGCGTGRNIILLARKMPHTRFTGLDISRQMLDFAKAKARKAGIADKVQFVLDDASSADIGISVDLAFFSYSLSMIPDWKSALHQAAKVLAPGGTLLIVDFSSMDGWPARARERVRKNLNWYNVQPRTELASYFRNTPDFMNWSISHREMLGSYAQIVELTKPKSGTAT